MSDEEIAEAELSNQTSATHTYIGRECVLFLHSSVVASSIDCHRHSLCDSKKKTRKFVSITTQKYLESSYET